MAGHRAASAARRRPPGTVSGSGPARALPAPLRVKGQGDSLDSWRVQRARPDCRKLTKQVVRVTSWSQWRRGRFWVEIVQAVLVGVAAFVVAAVASTAARSHVPVVLLGLLLLLAVLAVARLAGILYALPVGVVTIEAFDWYFLPPLRNLDGATVLVLGLFLGMSVIVGAVATQASRRAAGSERARGVLADEQAALRRMATLVARQPSPAEVFAAVTEETLRTARLLHLDSAHLIVYERDQTATVVGSWNLRGPPIPVGTRVPVEGDNIIGRVFRTRQPARIDDYGKASGLA